MALFNQSCLHEFLFPDGGDFWLGLEKMHLLTSQAFRTYQLQVVISDERGVSYIYPYDSVKVGSEGENYGLTLGTYRGLLTATAFSSTMPFIASDENTSLHTCSSSSNTNKAYYHGWWLSAAAPSRTRSTYGYSSSSSNCQKQPNLNMRNPYWSSNFDGVQFKIAKIVIMMKLT